MSNTLIDLEPSLEEMGLKPEATPLAQLYHWLKRAGAIEGALRVELLVEQKMVAVYFDERAMEHYAESLGARGHEWSRQQLELATSFAEHNVCGPARKAGFPAKLCEQERVLATREIALYFAPASAIERTLTIEKLRGNSYNTNFPRVMRF